MDRRSLGFFLCARPDSPGDTVAACLHLVPEGFHLSPEDGTHKWSNQYSFVIQAEFEATGVLGVSPPALQSSGKGRNLKLLKY